MDFLATPRRRRVLFTALYVSEGAPIGFLWWALPTWLRAQQVPVPSITALTAALALPWTLKFLWAPLVDMLRSGRWSYRQWILAAQVAMGAALTPLLVIDWERDFAAVAACLLIHAFAAATQDVAVDALSISVLHPDERGRMNGWMQAGMLLGRSALGGGALVLAETWGRRPVVLLLLAVIWSSLLLLLRSRAPAEPSGEAPAVGNRWRSFARIAWAVLRRRGTWLGLAFALTAGAGYEAVGGVAGPLLIDRGYAEARVGTILALPVVAAMTLGALLGGVLADRLGRRATVVLAQVLILAAVVRLALLVAGVPTRMPDVIFLLAMYFGVGLFTAASYALFMDLTDPELGATQFSAFMGATNACEAWTVFATGRWIALDPPEWLSPAASPLAGYPLAFLAMAAVSALSLLLLIGLPRRDSPDVAW